MFKDRIRKPTYEELEEELLNPKLVVLRKPIKIPSFDFPNNVDDVDLNDFDLDNYNLKTMMDVYHQKNNDKATQKDYELQNHDLYPEMYHEIDATGSKIGDDEKRTQTKRYIPKDFDI